MCAGCPGCYSEIFENKLKWARDQNHLFVAAAGEPPPPTTWAQPTYHTLTTSLALCHTLCPPDAMNPAPLHLIHTHAGNDGVNNDNSGSKGYPASYAVDNVVSVAATDRYDVLASFSNFGEGTQLFLGGGMCA
jgi:hypothetical protein